MPGRQNVDSLQERLAGRDNNFDVLRLAAALLVLVAHAFDVSGNDSPAVPLTPQRLGGLGVQVFFAISGILVARSWINEPRVVPFLIKRGLRILPGLVVVLVLTAYVLGPAVTTADKQDYLTSATPARYVVGSTLMLHRLSIPGQLGDVIPSDLLTPPAGTLPGVFEGNPDKSHYVDGPLWTLPIEVTAYTLLLLAGLIALWRAWPVRALLAALLGLGSVLAVHFGGEFAYPFLAAFAGGALLYVMRTRVALNGWLFAGSVAVWIASYHLPLMPHLVLIALTVPYAVMFLAFRGIDRLRVLTRPGDVSYGLYIYHWPVAQTIVLATGSRSAALVVPTVAVVTYAFAFASWRLVERPALRLKARLSHSSVTRSVVGAAPDLALTGVHRPPSPAAASE